MQDPYNELQQMLDNMPPFTSWTTNGLEELFIRFRGIVAEMIESDDYKGFRWLGQYCPDLGKRIEDMILAQETVDQTGNYNCIIFELQCAIEVLIGKIECNNYEEWVAMLERVSPRYAGA